MSLAGRKGESFLFPGTSVSHAPQILQRVHGVEAQFLAHLQVADVDVEDSDDRDQSEIGRGNAVEDAPEPPDVVTQHLPNLLFQAVEIEDGRRVRCAAGSEVRAPDPPFPPGSAAGDWSSGQCLRGETPLASCHEDLRAALPPAALVQGR